MRTRLIVAMIFVLFCGAFQILGQDTTQLIIGDTSPSRILIPLSAPPENWKAPSFEDGAWMGGFNGVGFDTLTGTQGAQGLAGFWKFDTAVLGEDSSGNNNILAPAGNPTGSPGGIRGNSLKLDGNSCLTASIFPTNVPLGNSPYTLSVWIKPTAGGSRGMVGWGQYFMVGQVNAFRLLDGNGFSHYWWGNDLNGDAGTVGINLFDGEWHHSLAIYDGIRRSLWLDGKMISSDTPAPNNAQPFNFAIGKTWANEFFMGDLDEVAIWNRALSENQILALARGATPLTLPDPAPLQFNEWIKTDVGPPMANKKTTAYLRFGFELSELPGPEELVLRLNYKDGFVAYLNGTEVARRHAPATPAWDSTATAARTKQEAVQTEEWILTDFRNLLTPGKNVLAVQGLTQNLGSKDFLVRAELLAREKDPFAGAPGFSQLGNSPVHFVIPTAAVPATWASLDFDDTSWSRGTNGVGFDSDTRTSGATGLIGHWAFDRSDLIGWDSTPNNNHLVPVGIATYEAQGYRGGALNVEGQTGHLISPAGAPIGLPTGDSAYTISVWIKPTSMGNRGMVGWGAWNSVKMVNAFRLMDANSLNHYWWGNDLISNANTLNINLGDRKWHHVLATYNKVNREIWVDGQLLTKDQPGANNSQPVSFAIGKTWGTEFFHGLLDDVAIWNISLPENQRVALARGATPVTLPAPSDIDFSNAIKTDVGSQMKDKQTSAYIRLPFSLRDFRRYDGLALNVKYDDGFIAYLNGTEVARRNAPANAQWDSVASGSRPDASALTAEVIDISSSVSLLQNVNVLAIHALNEGKTSSDFLFQVELSQLPLDNDSDGMPDRWELEFGLDPNKFDDAALDDDGDGFSNVDEYGFGTDPKDPQSAFRIDEIGVTGTAVEIRFKAKGGVNYILEASESLNPPSWFPLKSAPSSSQDRVVKLTDEMEPSVQKFYRIGIQR